MIHMVRATVANNPGRLIGAEVDVGAESLALAVVTIGVVAIDELFVVADDDVEVVGNDGDDDDDDDDGAGAAAAVATAGTCN